MGEIGKAIEQHGIMVVVLVIMLFSLLWLGRHIVTGVIPMILDKFFGALDQQGKVFEATLEKVEKRSELQHAAILSRLDQIGTRLERIEHLANEHDSSNNGVKK